MVTLAERRSLRDHAGCCLLQLDLALTKYRPDNKKPTGNGWIFLLQIKGLQEFGTERTMGIERMDRAWPDFCVNQPLLNKQREDRFGRPTDDVPARSAAVRSKQRQCAS